MSGLDVPFGVACNLAGQLQLTTGSADEPDPFIQALPFPPASAEDARQWIQDEHLTFRLDGPAADLRNVGYAWHTTYVEPSLWTEPSPPSLAVQALLPAPNSDGTHVPFREVDLDSAEGEASGLTALLRKQHAAQNTREFVRGSMGALPFAPGGEALVAADTAAALAAKEAASGAWLAELDSGKPSRITVPGLPHGLFGAWAEPELPDGASVRAPEPTPGELAAEAAAAVGAPATEVEEMRHQDGQALLQPEALMSGVWMPEAPAALAAAKASKAQGGAGASAAGASSILSSLELLPGEQTDMAPSRAAEEVEALLRASGSAPGASRPDAWMSGSGAGIAAPARKAGDTEWAVASGMPDLEQRFRALKPRMAHRFPFELDTFQKEAIIHLEQGESVFVAAHTSAGKTVVAEYAFALATRHCTRAVYTSPIKTISNQKYRDFSSTFEVGLLTGDVSMKPESPCLIMTTEILRSMLYKGADVVRDIEWVIFDEVHYVNDAERGVVWEEVIIMLPEHVNLVLLSATVPNVMEFADWVGRTKRKKLWVTGTTRRPVPLEHVLYYAGGFFPIARQDTLLTEGIAQAKAAHKRRNAVPATTKQAKDQRPTGRGGFGVGRGGRDAAGRSGRSAARAGPRGPSSSAKAAASLVQRGGGANATTGAGTERTQWLLLIDALKKREQLPVVVFCFSKRRCDSLVDSLASLDLTSADDKSDIQVFISKALGRLRAEDRGLPQIQRLQSMLRRGVGVHHAGLLPIMKEVVEMLFCRGLLRVLFCTETFAMGVNAPARTVVFQSLRKHDGKAFRTLLPGEYTQMAGRAGRRGLDPVGTVLIACWDDVPDEVDLRRLLTGKATRLQSQFRLTYSMILNLLRVEDLKVEDMLKRSFLEFHAQKAAPEAAKALARGQSALASLRAAPWPLPADVGISRSDVGEYVALNARIDSLSRKLQGAVMGTRPAQAALVPGRLVLLADAATGLPQLAALLSSPAAPQRGGGASAAAGFQVLALWRPHPLDVPAASAALPAAGTAGQNGFSAALPSRRGDASGAGAAPLPRYSSGSSAGGGVRWVVRQSDTAEVQAICRSKVRGDFEAATAGGAEGDAAADALAAQLRRIQEDAAGRGQEPELLDPVSDLRVTAFELVGNIREQQRLLAHRAAMPAQWHPDIGEAHALVRSEAMLAGRLRALAHSLSDANLSGMPEFQIRVDVLKRLQYVSADNTVAVKGRVACEINSGDELVATEMIFAGVLTELSPEEAVALLSALVFQERNVAAPSPGAIPPALAAAAEHATQLAYRAGEVQQAAGLEMLPDDYVKNTLNFGLMEVVYQWACGTAFTDICQLTDVMEGSIVRTVVRLDETCREFRDAARVMGDTSLWAQMTAASAAIKRDVVFAASLYVA